MRALILAALLLLPLPALSQDGQEVDPIALASVLAENGHHERAAGVLAQVDPATPGLDLGRLATLRGVVALKLGDHALAARSLQEAIRLAPQSADTRNLSLLLAQARFSEGHFEAAVDALDEAAEVADAIPEAHLMRVQARWSLGQPELAWAAVKRGAQLHPAHSGLARQEVVILVELGLYETAAEAGRATLQRPEATSEDFVAIAEVLRRARRFEEARSLLERAHLRHPDDLPVTVMLARTCADLDMPLAAAKLYQQAAMRAPEHAVEAAETFRRAGWTESALRLNALVPDAKVRARQRLGLLIEQELFEEACALEPRLSRLGLLDDEPVKYAVAYALFKIQDYERAEARLRGIKDAEIFEQASELRRIILACQQQPEACR